MIDTNGHVHVFGSNSVHQLGLGNGDDDDVFTPRVVKSKAAELSALAVGAGGQFSAVLAPLS